MTDPIIPQDERRVELIVTPGQTSFQFNFAGVAAPQDIRVYRNGAEITAFALNVVTKTVIPDDPVDTGDIMVIEGLLDIKRLYEYPRSGNLETRRLNPEMNFFYRVLQELRRDVNRAIVLNKAQIGATNVLPLMNIPGLALVTGVNGIEVSAINVNDMEATILALEALVEDASGYAQSAQESVATVSADLITVGELLQQAEQARDDAVAAAAIMPLNNYTATTNPSVTDDSGDGYSVGSKWVNRSASPDPEAFMCLDATPGAAIWETTTLDIDDLGGAAVRNVGTALGNVVEVVNVGGSPGLPALDGSQLLNIPIPSATPRTLINIQYFDVTGTYTPSTGATHFDVEFDGSSGGGGAGQPSGTVATAGGNSSFSGFGVTLTVNGGGRGEAAGTSGSPGSNGAHGSATGGDINITGGGMPGGQGGSSGTTAYRGNPGGNGAKCIKRNIAITTGTASITIGAAGTAGTATGSADGGSPGVKGLCKIYEYKVV